MNAPIGVFDSGVGGLTVVKEIMRQLPAENLVYFGDTARVPYGSKSQKTVCKYSKQIVRFLQTKQVKAIVVACNTASALALDEIRADLPDCSDGICRIRGSEVNEADVEDIVRKIMARLKDL